MENQWDAVDLNAIPNLKYDVCLEFGEGFPDWAYNIDQPTISTPPDTPRFDPNISTLAGTEQSNEYSALSSPILCEARPRQIEKRRAQNRASQRAFRQRQTCRIRALEQELEEIRTKYDKMRKYFEQVKEAVCEVEKEEWAGDCLESRTERSLSGDEKKRIRS